MRSKAFKAIFGTFLAIFLATPFFVARASTEVLDSVQSSYITSSNTSSDVLGHSSQYCYGQSFVMSTTNDYYITDIVAYLGKSGTPTDFLRVELRTDSSGSPSTTILANSSYLERNALDTGHDGWYSFTFRERPKLTANTTYWLVTRRNDAGSSTNIYKIGYSNAGYSSGVLKYSAPSGTSCATTWSTSAIGSVDQTVAIGWQKVKSINEEDGTCHVSAGTGISLSTCTINNSLPEDGLSHIRFQEEGSDIIANPDVLNFVGDCITLSNPTSTITGLLTSTCGTGGGSGGGFGLLSGGISTAQAAEFEATLNEDGDVMSVGLTDDGWELVNSIVLVVVFIGALILFVLAFTIGRSFVKRQ